jgi:hypothetical protein
VHELSRILAGKQRCVNQVAVAVALVDRLRTRLEPRDLRGLLLDLRAQCVELGRVVLRGRARRAREAQRAEVCLRGVDLTAARARGSLRAPARILGARELRLVRAALALCVRRHCGDLRLGAGLLPLEPRAERLTRSRRVRRVRRKPGLAARLLLLKRARDGREVSAQLGLAALYDGHV